MEIAWGGRPPNKASVIQISMRFSRESRILKDWRRGHSHLVNKELQSPLCSDTFVRVVSWINDFFVGAIANRKNVSRDKRRKTLKISITQVPISSVSASF